MVNLEDKRFKMIDAKLTPGILIYDKFSEEVICEICTGNKQITEYAAIAVWRLIHGDNELFKLLHDDYKANFGDCDE